MEWTVLSKNDAYAPKPQSPQLIGSLPPLYMDPHVISYFLSYSSNFSLCLLLTKRTLNCEVALVHSVPHYPSQ